MNTAAARPTAETVRRDGMVVAAAVPVFDVRGRLAAVLYAGDLLSRRFEIVDGIKREVFLNAAYEGQDVGTVAISQGDLRIATTFALEDGSRAVGTRLSAAVSDEVLGRGRAWTARAFVINDWYFTAYEPIRDPTGQVVGVLSVGLLQAPFVHRQRVIAGVLLAIVATAAAASLALIFLVINAVLRPIGAVVAMSRKVIAGNLSARVDIRPRGEMGVLCRAVDGMADALAEREEQLKRATSQQLGRSEKLASVGRLAAGVAHEINNPLTGVLSFACMLREKENMDDQDREDLDLIVHETTRAAQIVRGLLDFARERQVVKTPLDLNEVVRQTMRLLGNQKAVQGIVIVEDLADALPAVEGDAHQIEQVMLNLAMNACEAMPNGGTLLISSLAADGKVIVKFTDTGCGIKEEHLDQIFEPFFSTKPVGKGTGLGLSVSYGIIEEHGGALEVESQEGKGSTFTVVLPCAGRASGERVTCGTANPVDRRRSRDRRDLQANSRRGRARGALLRGSPGRPEGGPVRRLRPGPPRPEDAGHPRAGDPPANQGRRRLFRGGHHHRPCRRGFGRRSDEARRRRLPLQAVLARSTEDGPGQGLGAVRARARKRPLAARIGGPPGLRGDHRRKPGDGATSLR